MRRHAMRRGCAVRTRSWPSVLAASLVLLLAALASAQDTARHKGWLDEWAVVRGMSLSIDTEGYDLPTSLAFVPNPGSGPKDPLYFVTELHGALKVVTNDRSVHTFAERFFHLQPIGRPKPGEYLDELGMAGVCLDPVHGYVFVSFTYQTPTGKILNNVVRFQSTPNTFSLAPTGPQLAFTEIFSNQVGDTSHMIGPMIVQGDVLFVHVGDAHAAMLTRSLNSTAGKILRMTLDGKPLPDNPHYVDDNIKNPANFVWARGLRNPFGVVIVNDRYLITDVGPNIDRFLRVERDGDYGYDGTDWSISSHALVVFAPVSAAPVQLVYHPPDSGPLPGEWRDQLYLVASGDQLNVGPSHDGKKTLMRLKYDFAHDQVVDRPYEVIKYVGEGAMMPVGLGIGPDGLYIAVFNPQVGTPTYVMKVRYDPAHEHPVLIDRADELIEKYACFGCHQNDGQSPGPPLATELLVPRLSSRLNSAEYEQSSKQLDTLDEEPFKSFRKARREVREAKGIAKLRTWIKYRLSEPRFDMPKAAMPRFGIDAVDAATIAARLAEQPDDSLGARMRLYASELVPKPRQRHLIMSFGIGLVFGALAMGIVMMIARKLLSRRAPRPKA
jgi:hypothetical protein